MAVATIEQLTAINTEMNAIPYDAMLGSAETYDLWIDDPIPGDSWVCRDYVLRKGKALDAQGVDPDSMTIITCYTEPVTPPANPDDPTSGREYHAVLSVKIDGTNYILDSRVEDGSVYEATQPQVEPYNYLWWKQQDPPGTTQCRDASSGLI